VQDTNNSSNQAFRGLNTDTKIDKIEQGQVIYALNGVIGSFDGNFPAYQNEQGNTLCTNIPEGYTVIGKHEIPEDSKTILWMVSSSNSRIGVLDNESCLLQALVSSDCFDFDLAYPVLKSVHRKTNCSTEVYWVDGRNKPSFIDLDNLPYEEYIGVSDCDRIQTVNIDCNKARLQPNFTIPEISISSIRDDGDLTSGSYQFGVAYANSIGETLTSVYSITDIIPIFDPNVVTENYDYQVSKSIEVLISNLDITGAYQYFNLYVIKTVNNITSVYIVNTYDVTASTKTILYTGANKTELQGDILDIFAKYPVYETASDITNAQDVLILGGVTEKARVSYQKIANQIDVKWATIEKDLGDYKDPLVVNQYTGYLRNEVYALELVPLLADGVQRDGFTIPGRVATSEDLALYGTTDVPTWQAINTATKDGTNISDDIYSMGQMAYWESTELYPCDSIYGDLANQPIRHHKMPDNTISPYIGNGNGKMYPLGIHVDPEQIRSLILASDLPDEEKEAVVGFKIVRADRAGNKSIISKGIVNHVLKYKDYNNEEFYTPNYLYDDISNDDPFFKNVSPELSQTRFTFHGPNTSFAQPAIGSELYFEGSLRGTAKMHFKQVANHAKYVLPTSIIFVQGQALNVAYQLNSVGKYDSFIPLSPTYQKLDITLKQYLSPGIVGGDDLTINNFQRESSVYLKTESPLTGSTHSDDNTKALPDCTDKATTWERGLDSYYTAIGNTIPNQYGPLYSYNTIDTGYQYIFGIDSPDKNLVFGGDTFINYFAYKSKLPVFVDNMVGQPDNTDVIYSKKGNLGAPRYYIDMVGYDASDKDFEYHDIQLWCQGSILLGESGYMPLFIYGIPYYPVESEVNVDMRKAYNFKEGDFYPHVTEAIPDNWLKEEVCSIAQDNTYAYNVTFSKQNKENNFSHIPNGYDFDDCNNIFPFRCVFSEPQQNVSNPLSRNNWRIFKPASYFDFPQNYGKLVSLDGVENKEVYARFENKTLLYNALLTAPTTAQAVYLGQSLFRSDAPPLDFADTDLGYAGTQNKFFLKTENGNISVDAKRGNIFLYAGRQVQDLGKQGISKFLKKYLSFSIKESFPEIDTDNNFAGIGLTGVYDNLYDRLLITKLDYKPLVSGITYNSGVFRYKGAIIQLSDQRYFRNMSFTLSFSFDLKAWVSYHSYLPLYYIGDNKGFKTGITGSIWNHNKTNTLFNNFYGSIEPYILEVPNVYKYNDEILQSIRDYSKVDTFVDEDDNYVQVDDGYFSKIILSNDQQTSGIVKLDPRPVRNMAALSKYPIYNNDSKTVLYTKRDNIYKINTFWSVTVDNKKPLWLPSYKSLSEFKILNQSNCSYAKRSHNKAPFRAKDLKVRFILDDRSDIRITSQFISEESQESII
jgi:hypothetical protein